MRHRSIGERMDRAKSLEARRAAALDWAANWRSDHESTLAALERAVATRSTESGRLLGQLKALNAKAMDALPRVIEALADEDAV